MRARLLLLFCAVWFGWACWRMGHPAWAWSPSIDGLWLEDRTLGVSLTLHRQNGYAAVGFFPDREPLAGYYFAVTSDSAFLQCPGGRDAVVQHQLANWKNKP